MDFFIFILVGVGLTSVLVNGSIFESFRELIQRKNTFIGKLIHCPMCTGMWIGIFLGMFLYSPVGQIMFKPVFIEEDISVVGSMGGFLLDIVKYILSLIFDGCIISLFAWLVDSVTEFSNSADDYFKRSAENFEINEQFISYQMERDKKIDSLVNAVEQYLEYVIKRDESELLAEDVRVVEVIDNGLGFDSNDTEIN